MSMSLEEQETSIIFNRKEGFASVSTSDTIKIKKLNKLCIEFPDHYKCIYSTDTYSEYVCNKELVSLKKPYLKLSENEKKDRINNIKKSPNFRENF